MTPETLLDELVPVHQFSELHQITIRASRDRVFQAIREVTAAPNTRLPPRRVVHHQRTQV